MPHLSQHLDQRDGCDSPSPGERSAFSHTQSCKQSNEGETDRNLTSLSSLSRYPCGSVFFLLQEAPSDCHRLATDTNGATRSASVDLPQWDHCVRLERRSSTEGSKEKSSVSLCPCPASLHTSRPPVHQWIPGNSEAYTPSADRTAL